MSIWPGKYVIGLTGNIATGKSEVRRMLEGLGAYGIDADLLAHHAIAKGEPAYQAVLAEFGSTILTPDGQIERTRLGQIVFSDPATLSRLEAIIHPEVRKKVDALIRQTQAAVIVIEAIKLLEAGYAPLCDAIWVTAAAYDLQLQRLMEQRKMSEELARQRIAAQTSQALKIAAAQVVIYNEKSLEDTWQQVFTQWQKISHLE